MIKSIHSIHRGNGMSIAELRLELTELQEQINSFSLDEDDYRTQFNTHLDQNYEKFFGLNASYVLKEVDPTQYEEMLSNYVDGLSLSDDPTYQELEENLEEIESKIQELEDAEFFVEEEEENVD